MREQRKEIVREAENLSVLGLKRRENSIHREIGGRIKRKHNRINNSRAGQMVQSKIYNSEASQEMEENSEFDFTEKGDINDLFLDKWNRSSERFDKERRLQEKAQKFDLGNQTVSNCPYLNIGDLRAGKLFQAYYIKGLESQNCACDFKITGYSIDKCLKEKTCKFDLINQLSNDSLCLSTADPRENRTCPAYRLKRNETSDCTCDTNLFSYSVESCLKEKKLQF
ncbi:MAG: hypothetical protein EZS28_025093 [Streblomastix strix]|uniref:Uncharacterized protein n=1 Tax=Streblomastix strix TaxID=222440 RepID=A0A5J4VA94_9EUKA|nr:MAG: hypothetical protein EZS28_025093 [Streblomastix strix]